MVKIPIFEGKIYRTAGTLVIPIPAKHHELLKKEGVKSGVQYKVDIILTEITEEKNQSR